MYNRKDHYYKKAKAEGRASRAAYKLEQIQAKFRIIKKGSKVLDLGCAPGGWLEMLGEMVGKEGLVVGIDILPIKIQPKPNIRYVQGDVSKVDDIKTVFDVIVSDMAPNTSGIAFKDCFLSYELCTMALDTAKKLLKEGGNFTAKIFQGKEVEDFKRDLRSCFKKVDVYVPPATRQESKELYLVATCYHRAKE